HIRVLVTSRIRLRLDAEVVIELDPLEVPRAGDPIGSSASVQLWVERVRQVWPRYVLSDADAPLVAEMVRRLDGLPLAIELCAARMSVMSVRAILERLPNRVLCMAHSAGNARHATLRGAIEGSWDLLQPYEQQALAQCSVFRGGFDLQAAEC